MERNLAIALVTMERYRQEKLRDEGRFSNTCASADMPDEEKLAVLGEEFGEVCRAVLQKSRAASDNPDANIETELIHVAAVAMAWLESLEG